MNLKKDLDLMLRIGGAILGIGAEIGVSILGIAGIFIGKFPAGIALGVVLFLTLPAIIGGHLGWE